MTTGSASSAITSPTPDRSTGTAWTGSSRPDRSVCNTPAARCGCSTPPPSTSPTSSRSTSTASNATSTAGRRGASTGSTICSAPESHLRPLDLQSVGHELAGYGVTSVTDLTPTTDPSAVELLARHVTAPEFPLEVTITGALALPTIRGRRCRRGPVKLVVADHDLPEIDELAHDIHRAHQRGRNVALHCASRTAVVIALAAWDEASVMPGDRIEHGAEIPLQLIPRLAEFQLIVVTQPSFVTDRGDRYLHDVPPHEHADLWRCGTLLAAGVPVAAGTDAPFGDPDPWRAIAAAAQRTTAAGSPLGPAERIAAQRRTGHVPHIRRRPRRRHTPRHPRPARSAVPTRPTPRPSAR